jgi:hypothetical protein
MRFGLLGPANGDLAGLARCAEFLLNSARVTRAIYLGDDDALEETVALWAESLVGPNPSDEGIWERALPVVATGSSDQLDTFVRSERARLRLRSLERLPPEQLRSIEMLGDGVAVLIHDKAQLDEEDIFAATFLVYGRSTDPLVKRIGPRWFLTPGPIGSSGGCAVLDDTGDEVVATVYDAEGSTFVSETMAVVRQRPKLSVRR